MAPDEPTLTPAAPEKPSSPEEIDEIAAMMKPDNWTCSLCCQPGDLTVVVPMNLDMGVTLAEWPDGEVVPRIPKIHPGACMDAWEALMAARDRAAAADAARAERERVEALRWALADLVHHANDCVYFGADANACSCGAVEHVVQAAAVEIQELRAAARREGGA